MNFLDESTNSMISSDEADLLRSRMQSVRDRRAQRVGEIHSEAQRLVDWQEYVRSAPIVSLVGSVAAGFLAVSALRPGPPQPQSVRTTSPSSEPRVASGSNFQWMVAMVMPLVVNAGKKYLMHSLSTALQGMSNESKSTPKTAPERPVYSE